GISPSNQQAMASCNDGLCDATNLFRSLALSEYHLWKSLATGSIVVDAGEPQVFGDAMTRRVEDHGQGVVGRHVASPNGFEQLRWGFRQVVAPNFLICHGFRFDSQQSSFLELCAGFGERA